jgi:phosphomannomutase
MTTTKTEREILLAYIDSHQEEIPFPKTEEELALLIDEAKGYGVTFSSELLQDLKCICGIDPIQEFITIIIEEVKLMRRKYGH